MYVQRSYNIIYVHTLVVSVHFLAYIATAPREKINDCNCGNYYTIVINLQTVFLIDYL